jgi:hypothetical protein
MVVHSPLPSDCGARMQYCWWFQESVFSNFLDPELAFYSDKMWFTLNAYRRSLSNKYWSTEDLYAVHKMLVYNLNVILWCTVSAWRIIGSIFFMKQ